MEFTVNRITKTQKGTFVVKLISESLMQTELGSKLTQKTFYIAMKDVSVDEGAVVNLDMDLFTVKEYPFTTDDGNTINLKWLHEKMQ
jgi:hypothetical protein